MEDIKYLEDSYESFDKFHITASLIQKLAKARAMLINDYNIYKSGKNSQLNFDYIELKDFLPQIMLVCEKLGLLTVPYFNVEKRMAYLKIYDMESLGSVVFNQAVSKVENKRGGSIQEIQTDGALSTYAIRYLYKTAFAICDNDIVDAAVTSGASEEKSKLIKALDEINTNFSKLFNVYKTDLEHITEEQLKDALKRKSKAKYNELYGGEAAPKESAEMSFDEAVANAETEGV